MPSFKPQFGFSYVEKVQVAEKKLVHMVDRCTKAKNETEKVGKPVHMSLSEQERAVIKATKNQKRIDLKKQTSLAANKSF
jgi:hypothetical protein